MEIILIGLATNILTWVAKKFNISATYVSIGLSAIGGLVYWYLTNYNPELRQEGVVIVGGVYASSQIVYQIIKKIGVLDKIQ